MPSLSLSRQLIINFSSTISLSITDGSDRLKEKQIKLKCYEDNVWQDVRGPEIQLNCKVVIYSYWSQLHSGWLASLPQVTLIYTLIYKWDLPLNTCGG